MSEKLTGAELLTAARGLVAEGPAFDPDTGEVSDEAYAAWEARIEAWAESAGDKLGAYRYVRDQLKRAAADHRAEAAAHQKRAAALATQETRVVGLAHLLLEAHREATGETRVTLSDGRKAWLHPSVSVEVYDAEALPETCIRTVVSTSPDKIAIKRRLNGLEDVPGAQLVTRYSPRWS